MVQSAATSVDDYLAEQPEDRREALTRIRDLCRAELPGFTEVMAHGMPAYERAGSGGIAFAGQKRYISVYVGADVREAHAEELAGHDTGQSCLRFTGPARVDYDLVQRLLRSTAQRPGTA